MGRKKLNLSGDEMKECRAGRVGVVSEASWGRSPLVIFVFIIKIYVMCVQFEY